MKLEQKLLALVGLSLVFVGLALIALAELDDAWVADAAELPAVLIGALLVFTAAFYDTAGGTVDFLGFRVRFGKEPPSIPPPAGRGPEAVGGSSTPSIGEPAIGPGAEE
jgi:hypothetical protein